MKKVIEMLELIVLAFFIVICAAFSFNSSSRSSGRTRITRPTKETATGMGGVRARDYSYVDRSGKGFPVGLGRDKSETRSFSDSRRRKKVNEVVKN